MQRLNTPHISPKIISFHLLKVEFLSFVHKYEASHFRYRKVLAKDACFRLVEGVIGNCQIEGCYLGIISEEVHEILVEIVG